MGHAPAIVATADPSPAYLLVPVPENPPLLRFLSRSTPAIPKPIESRTNPDGSGAWSVTGVLKVSAKLGSSSPSVLIPMQYWPDARLVSIVLAKLSPLFSVADVPLPQLPAAPAENK